MELPTVQSITYRTGFDSEFNEFYEQAFSLPKLLKIQAYRLGGMVIPYVLSNKHAPDSLALKYGTGLVGIGASLACLTAIVMLARASRIPLLSFAVSGFLWSILLIRSFIFHDFEAMFFIGVPLTLFTLFLLYISQWLLDRHMAALAFLAALIFVASGFLMSQVGLSPAMSESHRQTIEDFESIRNLTKTNDVVLVRAREHGGQNGLGGARHAINYYLNGRIIVYEKGEYAYFNYDYVYEESGASEFSYDFLVTGTRIDGPNLLTPENHRVFLYRAEGE